MSESCYKIKSMHGLQNCNSFRGFFDLKSRICELKESKQIKLKWNCLQKGARQARFSASRSWSVLIVMKKNECDKMTDNSVYLCTKLGYKLHRVVVVNSFWNENALSRSQGFCYKYWFIVHVYLYTLFCVLICGYLMKTLWFWVPS